MNMHESRFWKSATVISLAAAVVTLFSFFTGITSIHEALARTGDMHSIYRILGFFFLVLAVNFLSGWTMHSDSKFHFPFFLLSLILLICGMIIAAFVCGTLLRSFVAFVFAFALPSFFCQLLGHQIAARR